jgi:hypothetical protein
MFEAEILLRRETRRQLMHDLEQVTQFLDDLRDSRNAKASDAITAAESILGRAA